MADVDLGALFGQLGDISGGQGLERVVLPDVASASRSSVHGPSPASSLRFTRTERHACTAGCGTDADCTATVECAGVQESMFNLPFAPSGRR